MATFLYQMLSSSSIFSLGLYHIFSTIRNYVKSPHSYSAKSFHPFPSPTSHSRLRHLQLYLVVLFLLVAFVHQLYISSESDPLLKGHTPVHRFAALQFAALLFLFLLLFISLLLSDSTSLLPLPPDLFFALASVFFLLQYWVSSSAASVQTSDLQAKCDSLSANISAVTAIFCLFLACQPKMFVADVGLGATICLQGLWVLQTGLSLHVDAFIPEGCHRMLDVVNGVEGSTKCDLEESKFRAVAILDLVFLIYIIFIVLIVIVIYAVLAKTVGMRKLGSYEPLARNSSASEDSHSTNIQMTSLIGTQA